MGLVALNDTGMLMYDTAAPFPDSFPHMVNSFSQHLSGQFTEGTEALFHEESGLTEYSRAAVVAPRLNRHSVGGSVCMFQYFNVKREGLVGQFSAKLF